MAFFLSLAIILALLVRPEESKIVQGSLRTGDNWAFLSRFCFMSMHGRFEYDVVYEARYAVQNIDLYYDTPHQWARVYGKRADLNSCREKESVLQIENNQFINLTSEMMVSGCHRVDYNITGAASVIRCNGTRNFNTARDRWWYVALSNCNSNKGLQLR